MTMTTTERRLGRFPKSASSRSRTKTEKRRGDDDPTWAKKEVGEAEGGGQTGEGEKKADADDDDARNVGTMIYIFYAHENDGKNESQNICEDELRTSIFFL